MKIKRLVAVTLIGAFTVAFLVFIASVFVNRKDEAPLQSEQPTASQPVNTAEPSTNNAPAANQTTEQTGTSTDCSKVGSTCSREEIAKHNSKSDCWVIYKGSYYNITSYVSQHEGGTAVFNDTTCGNDIEPYLNGQESSAGRTNQHGSSAYRDLETMKIGTVSN